MISWGTLLRVENLGYSDLQFVHTEELGNQRIMALLMGIEKSVHELAYAMIHIPQCHG